MTGNKYVHLALVFLLSLCVGCTGSNSDDQCRKSDLCIQNGKCTASKNKCIASKDIDCKNSLDCEKNGKCSLNNLQCVAQSSEDCLESNVCLHYGRCSVSGGECIVLSDMDCESSLLCAQGRCSAHENECVLRSDLGCQQLSECETHGKCSYVEGYGCVRINDKDCELSENCNILGHCTYSKADGTCILAKDKDCKSQYECELKGRCTFRNGECIPGTKDDCLQSSICIHDGRCHIVDNECRLLSNKDCQKWCKSEGMCYAETDYLSGRCIGSNKSCRKSKVCKTSGRCSYDSLSNSCVVSNDKDCAASEDCKVEGQCARSIYSCVPKTIQHCLNSTRCKTDGLCYFRGNICTLNDLQFQTYVKKRNLERKKFLEKLENTITSSKAQIVWVKIPAGQLDMDYRHNGQKKTKSYDLKSFFMTATEITVEQYMHCYEANACTSLENSWGINCNYTADDRSLPVKCATYSQAHEFAVWVGGTLPTQAQWQYAAKGMKKDQSKKLNLDNIAWHGNNTLGSSYMFGSTSMPVGLKEPNGFGLYDMFGNIDEWVVDSCANIHTSMGKGEVPMGFTGSTIGGDSTLRNLDYKYILKTKSCTNKKAGIRVIKRSKNFSK